MLELLFTPDRFIQNRRVDSWFDASFFRTNFWNVFFSMFAIEEWNDLAETRRYMRRFLHDVDNMVSGRAEVVTPYNNHDSMTVPMVSWLKAQGVRFRMGCKVTDLDFQPSVQQKLTVERIHYLSDGQETAIEVRPFDSAWMMVCVNTKDPLFFDAYEEFTGNQPGQANMVTFPDSNWHSSVLVPNHPHFRNQPEDVYIWLACGLRPFEKGNFVDKPMTECNGAEMLAELCQHFGFVKEMPQIIESSEAVPQMMPYEMSHFLTRKIADRPPVVPDGSTNLSLMGQFVESGECVMLVESSVRSAQIGVYSLLRVDGKVPPVYTAVNHLRTWRKIWPTLASWPPSLRVCWG